MTEMICGMEQLGVTEVVRSKAAGPEKMKSLVMVGDQSSGLGSGDVAL